VQDAITVLDAWIAARMAEREQPGLSIGIVYYQDVVWAKGYGYADLARKLPATPATLYRIASITKLFTSTAVLQLRDAGKLGLDDPITRHLPGLGIRNVHPQGPAITIRHLLTHTSGLPRQALGDDYNNLRFPTHEEMMWRLAEQETIFPAESLWKYSNLGMALAGQIVEAVSGEPYPQYVRNHILAPLGMDATQVLPARDTPGLATGYSSRLGRGREALGFVDRRSGTAAGNIASSVADLAKLVSLELRDGPAGGAQVLRGSTLREMQRVQWLRPDWKSGQGLGFALRRVGEQVRVGHGGSLPGFTSLVEFVPAERLGVIVLTNSDDGDPRRYVDQAFAIVGPAIARATARATPVPRPDPAWDRYVGTYTWKGDDIVILVLAGELTLMTPAAENPWDSRVTLAPAGPNRFRMRGGAIDGEPLVFDVDSSGRSTRVSVPGSYWLRRK
jgi:CubicO group peptidase (beta-lactamase class C family)